MAQVTHIDELQRLRIDDDCEADLQDELAVLRAQFTDRISLDETRPRE